MYVCFCHAVTDRTVRKAVARGASSVEEIMQACRAGSGCGGCRELLELLLGGSLDARAGSEESTVPTGTGTALATGAARFLP